MLDDKAPVIPEARLSHLNLLYLRLRRALMEVIGEDLQVCRIAFRLNVNTAVQLVPDKSTDGLPDRQLPRVLPEKDALYPAGNAYIVMFAHDL